MLQHFVNSKKHFRHCPLNPDLVLCPLNVRIRTIFPDAVYGDGYVDIARDNRHSPNGF